MHVARKKYETKETKTKYKRTAVST